MAEIHKKTIGQLLSDLVASGVSLADIDIDLPSGARVTVTIGLSGVRSPEGEIVERWPPLERREDPTRPLVELLNRWCEASEGGEEQGSLYEDTIRELTKNHGRQARKN